jgi:DNA-binding XRE family transcriptional regulator
MRLRNRVRAARQARGITQIQLAEDAGMTRQTLAAIEKDDGHEPYGWVMTALSSVLDDPGLFWWEASAQPVEAVG